MSSGEEETIDKDFRYNRKSWKSLDESLDESGSMKIMPYLAAKISIEILKELQYFNDTHIS